VLAYLISVSSLLNLWHKYRFVQSKWQKNDQKQQDGISFTFLDVCCFYYLTSNKLNFTATGLLFTSPFCSIMAL